MQRPSSSIAGLAAALAEAQAELANPDKSQVAIIRSDGGGEPSRSFAMRRFQAGSMMSVRPWASRDKPVRSVASLRSRWSP